MSKEFSEDKLIQASAADLLEKELGWTAVYAMDEVNVRVLSHLSRQSGQRDCRGLRPLY